MEATLPSAEQDQEHITGIPTTPHQGTNEDLPLTGDKAEGEEQEAPRHISLKVVSQDGSEVYFKIKKRTTLSKLIDTYCSRAAISPASVRFLYDGVRVDGTKTPEDLDMEDDDILDVVLQQTGGVISY